MMKISTSLDDNGATLLKIEGGLDASTFGDLNKTVDNPLAQVMVTHSIDRALTLDDR